MLALTEPSPACRPSDQEDGDPDHGMQPVLDRLALDCRLAMSSGWEDVDLGTKIRE